MMDNPTLESIPIDYASFNDRFFTSLIDNGILCSITITIAIFLFISTIFGSSFGLNNGIVLAVIFIFFIVLRPAYFVFFWVNKNGQTPGEKFFNIKVIKNNNQPMDIKVSFIRSFLHEFGLWWLRWSDSDTTWGDKLSGTLVVNSK